MSKISVGQSVRTDLEPDDDGVQFANCANARMVDVVVDDVRSNAETECSVYAMCQSYELPRRCEVDSLIVKLNCSHSLAFLGSTNDALDFLCCNQLDQVAHEEMRRDKEEKNGTIDDVLPAIIVARQAQKYAIFAPVFNHEAEIGPNYNLLSTLVAT